MYDIEGIPSRNFKSGPKLSPKAARKWPESTELPPSQGVHGRNSDNTLIQEQLGWQPGIALADGMARTYEWILEQYKKANSG